MRNLAAFVLFLVIAGCKEENGNKLNMDGAYSMTIQVLNDGMKDSVIDRKQLKIYTDKHIMYASPNVADSFANFGIGTYEEDNGKVIERIFYRASTGNSKDSLVLDIKKTENGYVQVINAINIGGKNYKLTEDYDDVGTNTKHKLDGAWKQVKNVYRNSNGDSSVNNQPLEYKVYHSGYFIWAITVTDSAANKTSVFGYGRFEKNGDNKINETVQNSTFVQGLVGKTYEVDIQFDGDDKYSQTITFANGDKSTEFYERLKE